MHLHAQGSRAPRMRADVSHGGKSTALAVMLNLRSSGSRSRTVSARAVSGAEGRSKVVCVGEALFDLIADQQGLTREQVQSWTAFAGGAPCNVATALGKLGQDVLFVTALGKDKMGDDLYDLIKASGVNMSAIERRGEPTRDVYVTRDNKGDREFAGFGRPTGDYCDCFIDPEKLPINDIKGAAMIVTGTLGLAYPQTRAAMHKAVKAAKESGCSVLIDVNWRPVFWESMDEARKHVSEFLQLADLIKLSDSDLKWLLGLDLNQALMFPCSTASHFPNATGVLVTAGEEGAAYCFKGPGGSDLSGFVPVFDVKAVDTTGAGDCFTAGFIYRVLKAGGLQSLTRDALTLKQAVVFASACGALTTTRKGAIEGQPKLNECEALYEKSKEWYNFW